MAREVALYDAKNSLSALVAEVEKTGGEIIITRHGKPAVKIAPLGPRVSDEERARVFRQLAEERDRMAREHPETARPFSWEELKADMEENR